MHTRFALVAALAVLCTPGPAHAATTAFVGETGQDRSVRLVADAGTGLVKRVTVGFRARCERRTFRDTATVAPRGDTPETLRVGGSYRVRGRGGLVAVVGLALRGRRSDEVWRGAFAAKVVVRRGRRVVDRCSTPRVRWRAVAPLMSLPDDPASLAPSSDPPASSPAPETPPPAASEPESPPPSSSSSGEEAVQPEAREWRFTMDSEEGDYIGGGEDHAYGSPGDRIRIHTDQRALVSVSIDGANGDWWYADFDTPGVEPMVAKRYDGATRYPFNEGGEPGLSVSGNGRGCNELTGEFTVEEVNWNEDGTLRSLRVVYEQHCEGGETALRGRLEIST
ncbi:MAG TPA: hypothetical protein VF587_20085 [Solirubrobacteraceae bacterium]|jgi:hypothetical protein